MTTLARADLIQLTNAALNEALLYPNEDQKGGIAAALPATNP